jgi:hypothetical protein
MAIFRWKESMYLKYTTTQNTTILTISDVKILKFTGPNFNTCQVFQSERNFKTQLEIFEFVLILFVIR